MISLDASGNERWAFATDQPSNGLSSPAFTTDHSAIIVCQYRTVYKFSSTDGSIIWQLPIDMDADFRSSPAVDDENNIYAASHGLGQDNDESTLYCIEHDGSSILWHNNIGGDMYSSPALGDDRTVYIGSEGHNNIGKQNRLHALDMQTGDCKWSAQLNMDVTWSSPAISDNGTLYISTMDINGEESGVYSFRTDANGLLPNCGSPRFHQGNESTGRLD